MKRVVLDIETVPTVEMGADAEPEAIKKASLDALTGRIVCVGAIAINDFTPETAIAFVSAEETLLLQEMWSWVGSNRIRGFVAHNGLSFDLPFLWRRSVIRKVKPSLPLDLRKYRSDSVFDTMCVWGNWEPRGFTSLDDLSRALEVGEKSRCGADVYDLWNSGRLLEIGEYCLQDCWLTYRCFCRMNFVEPKESLEGTISMLHCEAAAAGSPAAP